MPLRCRLKFTLTYGGCDSSSADLHLLLLLLLLFSFPGRACCIFSCCHGCSCLFESLTGSSVMSPDLTLNPQTHTHTHAHICGVMSSQTRHLQLGVRLHLHVCAWRNVKRWSSAVCVDFYLFIYFFVGEDGGGKEG